MTPFPGLLRLLFPPIFTPIPLSSVKLWTFVYITFPTILRLLAKETRLFHSDASKEFTFENAQIWKSPLFCGVFLKQLME